MAWVVLTLTQVHHILSEVIQGGLVLETNVEEIDYQGTVSIYLWWWSIAV